MSNHHDQECEPDEVAPERARVVVRFRDGVRLPAVDPEEHVERCGVGPWEQLTARFPGLRMSPVFTPKAHEQLAGLIRRALRADPTYKPADFAVFYYLDAPPGTDLV